MPTQPAAPASSEPAAPHAAVPPEAAGARRLAAATLRLYRADWQVFATWCAAHAQTALPATPASVAAYLAAQNLRGGTLARRAAAIAHRHRTHGMPSPTADPQVTALLHATRKASPSQRPPRPRPAQLVRLAATCPRDTAGLRDRALLLLAAATPGRAGLGHAALLGLTVEQLAFTQTGVTLHLPDAPPDDDPRGVAEPAAAPHRTLCIGAGHTRSPGTLSQGGTRPGLCPVQALRDWLQASATQFGPVFRKVDRWGNVEHHPLALDALRRIIARRSSRRGGTRSPGGTPRRRGTPSPGGTQGPGKRRAAAPA